MLLGFRQEHHRLRTADEALIVSIVSATLDKLGDGPRRYLDSCSLVRLRVRSDLPCVCGSSPLTLSEAPIAAPFSYAYPERVPPPFLMLCPVNLHRGIDTKDRKSTRLNSSHL